MTSDFTLDKYAELCSSIFNSGYMTLTFREYLVGKSDKLNRFVILRHDVDRKPFQALKMAELESRLGIQSTYYFRYPFTFLPDILRKVENMGHEVGYHYEVLSKASGDFNKAAELFDFELTRFREICDVKTICMHGRPLSRYDNRALWNIYNFTDYGIIGEAYLSIAKDVDYFSDTGRTWSGRNSLRDFIPGKKPRFNISSTSDLIDFLGKGEANKIYVLSHPERWATNHAEWCLSYAQDLAFNIGKHALCAMRG